MIDPLSPERYRVQFTADAELKRKLDLARDLLRHAVPSGDLATIVGRALDLLIEKTLQRRFGQTRQERTTRPTAGHQKSSSETPAPTEGIVRTDTSRHPIGHDGNDRYRNAPHRKPGRDNSARDNSARDNSARDNSARDNSARDNDGRDNDGHDNDGHGRHRCDGGRCWHDTGAAPIPPPTEPNTPRRPRTRRPALHLAGPRRHLLQQPRPARA